MANIQRYTVKLELEELRTTIPSPPNNDELLNDLLPKINNIHASYLFYDIGGKLLQQLCLCLCATKNSFHYSGWKELANALSLNPLLPQSLENCNINNQDPVYNLFFAYVQQEDASISKLYTAIHRIGRYDIINRTKDLLLEFCQKTNEESIKQLPELPTPHILRNLDKAKINEIIMSNKVKEVLLNSQSIRTTENKKRKYDKVIMLTYVPDDLNIAKLVAHELRKERNGKRIGVIILQEHVGKVNTDPETFISNCFTQTHFILPIMSVSYLDTVTGCKHYCDNGVFSNIDGYYVKYIHSLMTYNYIQSGCRNKKIRCIIPDEQCDQALKHPIASNPEFRVWFKFSFINEFAQRILTSNI